MSTPATGDLPDWSVLVNPNIKSASFSAIPANNSSQLFQSATPYRIWAAWISISGATSSTYAGGYFEWGARIGDGSGASLLRASLNVIAANEIADDSIALPISGYTPILSAGFFTTNFITEAGITNGFFRGSGGILYSQP